MNPMDPKKSDRCKSVGPTRGGRAPVGGSAGVPRDRPGGEMDGTPPPKQTTPRDRPAGK